MSWQTINQHLNNLVEQNDAIDAQLLFNEFVRVLQVKPTDKLWYFAYGSQIWAPGFSVGLSETATIDGYFRDYCILSHLYRGTADNPGLVLGLKPEASAATAGIAFQIAVSNFEPIFRQEMVSGVYRPIWLDVHLSSGGATKALTFVCRAKQKTVVSLSIPEQANLIIRGTGNRGHSLDYFTETQKALLDLGIADPRLSLLEKEVNRLLQQRQHQQ